MTTRREEARERLLKKLPKQGVGAEIGVWKGIFTERILEVTKPRVLHLIDPWIYQPDFNNTSFGNKKYADEVEGYYHNIVERYANDPRIKIHRMTSDEAFANLENGSLDWVYLDGNHNSPFIENDLGSALVKVKPNGCIAGDDFHWKSDGEKKPVYEAVRAVEEILGDRGKLKIIGSQYVFQLKRE